MQSATPPPTIPLDRIVQARQAIKDARTVKRHAWEQADAALEVEQHTLDMVLLGLLNSQGASSIATEHGTVIRSLKIKPSAADWGAIWDWMKENNAAELLERRLKTGFIKEYMEAHEGAVPPGINVVREYEVSVRRPNSTASGGSPASQTSE